MSKRIDDYLNDITDIKSKNLFEGVDIPKVKDDKNTKIKLVKVNSKPDLGRHNLEEKSGLESIGHKASKQSSSDKRAMSEATPLAKKKRPVARFAAKLQKPRETVTRFAGRNRQTGRLAATPINGANRLEFDNDAKGLWGCDTIEAVEAKWQKWNQIFQRKVLSAFKRQKIPDAMLACVLGWFDGTATSSTISTGDRIRGDAWRHLQANLAALAADDPDFQVVFVTIIAGTGATSHNKPVIDLHSAQSKAQVTLRAMSPNFFAVSELVLFNSTSHPDGGQLIQEHTHAFVFGAGALAKAREVAARHMPRFTPNATNAPQIVLRTVETSPINLARISAYMFKAPHRCSTWCPPRDGKKGHMNHGEKGDRYTRYLRMAMIRAMLTIEDITFAGGEGQRIRSQTIKMARPRCAAEAPANRRLLHPDAIGAFCVDLARALSKADWSLPVIRRQK